VFAHKDSLVGSIGVVSMLANMKKPVFDSNHINRSSIYTSDKLLERRFDVFREDFPS
jgi:ClpP class serine protease